MGEVRWGVGEEVRVGMRWLLTSSGIDNCNARKGCDVIKLFEPHPSISDPLNLEGKASAAVDVNTATIACVPRKCSIEQCMSAYRRTYHLVHLTI